MIGLDSQGQKVFDVVLSSFQKQCTANPLMHSLIANIAKGARGTKTGDIGFLCETFKPDPRDIVHHAVYRLMALRYL